MRHPTPAVLLAAALLATTAACTRDATPTEPTLDNATATCVDHLHRATGHDVTVAATTVDGEHAWTITGHAGDTAFTCRVSYTLDPGGGMGSQIYYETYPPLDDESPT
ncbi:hypothetical protein [Georgenia thermotolerans]|uniref:DUF4333 domain-containing protein n=1 Tax=Georgenia thermotolerans TaxID=527326 RepID=A0A7J5ULU0_9MICO|nr:hypothetical protein [Georgenia thermotolerans]KAE8763241.1 hypothetical protein GB883_15115 [Georgenia thermotolerans]